jgi:hypothetical protein
MVDSSPTETLRPFTVKNHENQYSPDWVLGSRSDFVTRTMERPVRRKMKNPRENTLIYNASSRALYLYRRRSPLKAEACLLLSEFLTTPKKLRHVSPWKNLHQKRTQRKNLFLELAPCQFKLPLAFKIRADAVLQDLWHPPPTPQLSIPVQRFCRNSLSI